MIEDWIKPDMKFGKLTTIEDCVRGKYRYWKCRCDCGAIHSVYSYSLKKGRIKSCGCAHFTPKHGHCLNRKHSSTYASWSCMIARCTNPNGNDYKNYGGRGIKIDPQWLSFTNFLRDMGTKPPGLTLDRKNTNDNYYKENCRWASRREQNNNTRRNITILFNGQLTSIPKLSVILSVPYEKIYYHMVRFARTGTEMLRRLNEDRR